MQQIVELYAAVLGVCIGSFLNVVIHRMPRRESVVRPASHCPGCGYRLRWREKIPLLSFARLRGRCASCTARIPLRYPLVEAAAGLVFVGVVHRFGWSPAAMRVAVLAAVLLAAAEIDRQHGIVPNRLVAAASLLALACTLGLEPEAFVSRGFAAGTGATLLLLLRAGSALAFGRAGLGLGDVKLAGAVGLLVGWDVLWILYLAFLLGGLLGLAGLLMRRLHRTSRLPFAPFVAAGAALHLLLLSADWPLQLWHIMFAG